MTSEELKKKAESSYWDSEASGSMSSKKCYVVGYIAGAKEAQKEADAYWQNIITEQHKLVDECRIKAEQEIEQLRKQVGKMKNSLNCQTWNEWQCPYARDNNDKDYNLIKDRKKCPCDKWRIRE